MKASSTAFQCKSISNKLSFCCCYAGGQMKLWNERVLTFEVSALNNNSEVLWSKLNQTLSRRFLSVQNTFNDTPFAAFSKVEPWRPLRYHHGLLALLREVLFPIWQIKKTLKSYRKRSSIRLCPLWFSVYLLPQSDIWIRPLHRAQLKDFSVVTRNSQSWSQKQDGPMSAVRD